MEELRPLCLRSGDLNGFGLELGLEFCFIPTGPGMALELVLGALGVEKDGRSAVLILGARPKLGPAGVGVSGILIGPDESTENEVPSSSSAALNMARRGDFGASVPRSNAG
jgi:hypothetical protein